MQKHFEHDPHTRKRTSDSHVVTVELDWPETRPSCALYVLPLVACACICDVVDNVVLPDRRGRTPRIDDGALVEDTEGLGVQDDR